MSITVRLWSDDELERAKGDEWLATLLMNKKTYTDKERKAHICLPYQEREFICYWNKHETVKIQAPNPMMLKKFIEAKYTCWPDEVQERKVEYVLIKL